jgi:hypothetical protein
MVKKMAAKAGIETGHLLVLFEESFFEIAMLQYGSLNNCAETNGFALLLSNSTS